MQKQIETHLEGNVLAKSLQPLFHIFRTCLCTIASSPHTQHFQQDQAQKKSRQGNTVWHCESWSSCAVVAMHTKRWLFVGSCMHARDHCSGTWICCWNDSSYESMVVNFRYFLLLVMFTPTKLGEKWVPIWWMYGLKPPIRLTVETFPGKPTHWWSNLTTTFQLSNELKPWLFRVSIYIVCRGFKNYTVTTLPKTNISPENRHSQKESSLPTTNFQGIREF